MITHTEGDTRASWQGTTGCQDPLRAEGAVFVGQRGKNCVARGNAIKVHAPVTQSDPDVIAADDLDDAAQKIVKAVKG